MKKEMRMKEAFMVGVGIVFLVLLGALLFFMQTNLSLANQRQVAFGCRSIYLWSGAYTFLCIDH